MSSLFHHTDRLYLEKDSDIVDHCDIDCMYYFKYIFYYYTNSYIVLSGKIEVEEEGKNPIILEDSSPFSFLLFSEVLQILLQSSIHLVLEDLLF